MTHEHQVLHRSRTDNGRVIEVCECGASRFYWHGDPPGPWHACELCTPAWGRDRAR